MNSISSVNPSFTASLNLRFVRGGKRNWQKISNYVEENTKLDPNIEISVCTREDGLIDQIGVGDLTGYFIKQDKLKEFNRITDINLAKKLCKLLDIWKFNEKSVDICDDMINALYQESKKIKGYNKDHFEIGSEELAEKFYDFTYDITRNAFAKDTFLKHIF